MKISNPLSWACLFIADKTIAWSEHRKAGIYRHDWCEGYDAGMLAMCRVTIRQAIFYNPKLKKGIASEIRSQLKSRKRNMASYVAKNGGAS